LFPRNTTTSWFLPPGITSRNHLVPPPPIISSFGPRFCTSYISLGVSVPNLLLHRFVFGLFFCPQSCLLRSFRFILRFQDGSIVCYSLTSSDCSRNTTTSWFLPPGITSRNHLVPPPRYHHLIWPSPRVCTSFISLGVSVPTEPSATSIRLRFFFVSDRVYYDPSASF
jgi:hypothetical protein